MFGGKTPFASLVTIDFGSVKSCRRAPKLLVSSVIPVHHCRGNAEPTSIVTASFSSFFPPSFLSAWEWASAAESSAAAGAVTVGAAAGSVAGSGVRALSIGTNRAVDRSLLRASSAAAVAAFLGGIAAEFADNASFGEARRDLASLQSTLNPS